MAGHVVKCIFDFNGDRDGDLSLSVGNLVKITNAINDDWYEGVSENGSKGRFPKIFTEGCEGIIDLAIAVSKFDAEQENDLSLETGDLVLVSEVVDQNWLQGFIKGISNKKGIFPKDFVKSLNGDIVLTEFLNPPCKTDFGTKYFIDAMENISAQPDYELALWSVGEVIEDKSTTTFVKLPPDLDLALNKNFKAISKSVIDTNIVAPLKLIEGSVPSLKKKLEPFKKAVALFSFISSESGDLNFEKDSEILIIEEIDENWLRGQFKEKVGIFPASFVKIIQEDNLHNIKSNLTNKLESQMINYYADAVLFPENVTSVGDYHDIAEKISSKENYLNKKQSPNQVLAPTGKKLHEEDSLSIDAFKLNAQPLLIIPLSYRKNESSNVIVLTKIV